MRAEREKQRGFLASLQPLRACESFTTGLTEERRSDSRKQYVAYYSVDSVISVVNFFTASQSAPVSGASHPPARSRWLGIGTLAAVVLTAAGGWAWLNAYPARLPAFPEVKAAWVSSEAYLLDRHGQIIHAQRVDHRVRRLPWTDLSAVSPALVTALVAAEDRRFHDHHGVDWRALGTALVEAARGRPVRGASTLTMQVAAYLDPGLARTAGRRSLAQKLTQVRAALALERSWRKQEVLEAYLNLASFRGELRGVAASARGVLHKHPSGLTEAESALLAATLPSPNADPRRIGARACRIAEAAGFALACEELRALALAVLGQPPRLEPDVALAPALATRHLRTPGERRSTTLDADLQRLSLDALRRQLLDLDGRNVRDGAALVLDNASGDVLAYVGSAGPASGAPRVDGASALRQAGSTLKPFLYALALERRYLTAASVLDDSPVSLGTASGLYVPQNYDRDFHGPVSVRTALASSLNIPAVRVLVQVGVEDFRNRLRDLGYASLTEDGEYYGYSLALGSADVSLLAQVSAYRALANGGLYAPLRVLADAPVRAPRRVMDPRAAFVVSQILSDPAGRAPTFGLDNPLTTRYWSAVKTGTSKDMRDNWCIGFSQHYTVGVWIGNFEGDSMQGVSGVSGAAPAWLEIMNTLHAETPSVAPSPPPGVVSARVQFEPAIEPARQEWFLDGTETARVRLAGRGHGRARIESPPDGVIIALDPDIPPRNQQVLLAARDAPGDATLVLDGDTLGRGAETHAWSPTPGAHVLTLVEAGGATLDTVSFQVRGAEKAPEFAAAGIVPCRPGTPPAACRED